MAGIIAALGQDRLNSNLQVDTQQGRLQGGQDSTSRFWLGVPYAAAGRFAPPSPPPARQHTATATSQGPICPQRASFGRIPPQGLVQSEDCQNLNLFAPLQQPFTVSKEGGRVPTPMPILVLLDGPSGAGGAATVSAATLSSAMGANPPAHAPAGVSLPVGWAGDAGALAAATSSLVVTLNYRVGPLGFLSHLALRASQGWAGNYGLLDQRAALQWLVSNAAGFGGDPSSITLVGVGAGAATALLHLSMPGSVGLMHRVVALGGALTSNDTVVPALEADDKGDAFGRALGCLGHTAPACLASASLTRLLDLGYGSTWVDTWGPSEDGAYLREADPLNVFKNTLDLQATVSTLVLGAPSSALAIPLLFALHGPGASADAAVALTGAQAEAIVASRFQGWLGVGPAVLAHYGANASLTTTASAANAQWVARVLTDGTITCRAEALAAAAFTPNGGAVPRTQGGGAVAAYLLGSNTPMASIPGSLGPGGIGGSFMPLLTGSPCWESCLWSNGTQSPGEMAAGGLVQGMLGAVGAGRADVGQNLTAVQSMPSGSTQAMIWPAYTPSQLPAWLTAGVPASGVAPEPQCAFWETLAYN